MPNNTSKSKMSDMPVGWIMGMKMVEVADWDDIVIMNYIGKSRYITDNITVKLDLDISVAEVDVILTKLTTQHH